MENHLDKEFLWFIVVSIGLVLGILFLYHFIGYLTGWWNGSAVWALRYGFAMCVIALLVFLKDED